jgi:hypothetical protein
MDGQESYHIITGLEVIRQMGNFIGITLHPQVSSGRSAAGATTETDSAETMQGFFENALDTPPEVAAAAVICANTKHKGYFETNDGILGARYWKPSLPSS